MRVLSRIQVSVSANRCAALAALSFAVCIVGCGMFHSSGLPSRDRFAREQLRFHSDFRLPRRHRLVDELTARRRDIADRLLLPLSDEPIHVYLFEDEKRFGRYLKEHHPLFPNRRAFFVKNDTELNVFAHWGDHIGEDLRHEVTHGYLHSVVSRVPLWLDEGLAEYFELPRGTNGFHRQHIFYLTKKARDGDWHPSLQRLETLNDASELTQLDYAEAWLWVHFLMETRPSLRTLLQDQLARLRMSGDTACLSCHLEECESATGDDVLKHLTMLAAELEDEQDDASP